MFGLLLLAPDSPQSLLQRGNEEQSKEAIYWLTQSKSVAEHKIGKMIEVSYNGKQTSQKNLFSILPLLKNFSVK